MTGDRRPRRIGHWASQARRVALVAVLAIASSALLPLAHGATSHFGDCGVCSVYAHHGAGVVEAAPAPDLRPLASGPEVEPRAADVNSARRAFDPCEARAPPATSVSI